MEPQMLSWIGWLATAVFASSYFCKSAKTLRGVQGIAALLWIGYGMLIRAIPIVVANTVVAVLANYSAAKSDRRERLKP